MGLVRPSVGEEVLVKLSAGAGGIDQTFCWSRWDWTKSLQDWVGLVKRSPGAGGVCQIFPGSR